MKNLIILTAIVLLSPMFSKSQSKDPELDYIKTTYSKEKKTIADDGHSALPLVGRCGAVLGRSILSASGRPLAEVFRASWLLRLDMSRSGEMQRSVGCEAWS